MFRRLKFLATIALLGAAPASAQDFGPYEFQTVDLGGGILLLQGAGGNVALSTGPDGPLLVDADYDGMSDKLLAVVQEKAGATPRLAVNTHWHFDHVGGNVALRGTGCLVVAHENVRRRMAAGQHLDYIDHDQPPAAPEALPDLTFTESLTLHWNGQEVRVTHPAPAHTDGDAVVHFVEADVIHSGDLVFNCGYPFIDVVAGGGIDGVIAGVNGIIEMCGEDTKVIPGHGPLTDREGLRTYLGMLQDFRAAVAKEKAAGKSVEEIVASGATAAVDEKFGAAMFPPDVFTAIVYATIDED